MYKCDDEVQHTSLMLEMKSSTAYILTIETLFAHTSEHSVDHDWLR